MTEVFQLIVYAANPLFPGHEKRTMREPEVQVGSPAAMWVRRAILEALCIACSHSLFY